MRISIYLPNQEPQDLNTWLRSTMGEERLSGLALMYIHRNIALNNEHIIKTWYNMSNRRIQLSFESD